MPDKEELSEWETGRRTLVAEQQEIMARRAANEKADREAALELQFRLDVHDARRRLGPVGKAEQVAIRELLKEQKEAQEAEVVEATEVTPVEGEES